jgi:hypothetical protein
MGGWLKQSTAAHIMFGPFLDKTDGVTLEVAAGIITSIDHATTGIFLSKNGGAGAIRHQGVTASVLDAYGMFQVHLDDTDTNTVGHLRVMMAEAATFLPIWDDYMVLPANVYDSLMGTDLLDVNDAQLLGTAYHAPALAGVPYVDVHNWLGSAAPAMTGDAYASIGAPVGASISVDVAAVKTDVGTAITAIGDVHATDLPALKTVVDNIHDTDLPAVKVDTAAILADTGTDGVVVVTASKTGYALSTAGVDAILDEVIGEPAGVVAWATGTLRQWVGWLGALSRNKITQTVTTQTLKNDADDAALGTSTVSDDGTTATRGEFS